MTETTCPRCLFHFTLQKSIGTIARWLPRNPKPSAILIMRALRNLSALSESSAAPRKKIAIHLLGQGHNMKVQNVTSRTSELVGAGLVGKVRGRVQEDVSGVLRWRPVDTYHITPAGLAYLERGEQVELEGVAA